MNDDMGANALFAKAKSTNLAEAAKDLTEVICELRAKLCQGASFREVQKHLLELVVKIPLQPPYPQPSKQAFAQISEQACAQIPKQTLDESFLTPVFGDATDTLSRFVRFATESDIETICDLRLAQSLEYWGMCVSDDVCQNFLQQTSDFLHKTLNKNVFFALIECESELASMSGLEVLERVPVMGGCAISPRSATIIACYTRPCYRAKGYMRDMISTWTALAEFFDVGIIYVETHNTSMSRIASAQAYEHVSDRYRLILSDTSDKDDFIDCGGRI